MNGMWILLLLILVASLPAITAFLWFRVKKPVFSLSWYLLSLASGIVSLFIAAIIQSFFIPSGTDSGLLPVFFNVFVRVALVEEASRVFTLVPLFKAGKRRLNFDKSLGAAFGLTAGLGFAALENAFYGMADINITLLRAFAAAPLHGACGLRAGAAVFTAGKQPTKAIFFFVSAVIIHGAYNLLTVSSALPPALAIPAAFAAFLASLYLLKRSGADDEKVFISPFGP